MPCTCAERTGLYVTLNKTDTSEAIKSHRSSLTANMELTGLLIQGREESIPLKSISVQAFLQGYVVGFRSKLSYENDSSDPLEVVFRTPVDDSYAVVDLEAVIDGRRIRAEIREKKKAREMYDEAIASGHTAAFGAEVKGDIFMLVLGNLPPGKKAEIHLTMVGELDIEADGSVRFVLPTVLKPRYTPHGSTDPLKPITTGEEKPVKHAEGPLEYNFNLVINGAEDVAQVTSPSHRILTHTLDQVINVSLEEDNPKDIVILVHPKEPHRPLVIVEPGLSDGENDFQKSAAVMVSFFPEFSGDASCIQAACEFVFVIDRSGSMGGQYIRDAAQTLLLFLKSIPEGCYFNIIGFGSSYQKLFSESVPYNQENLEKAEVHVKGLQADLGGTELFDPLKHIFDLAQMKGLPRQVFVLTDGSVSNTESVIKLVEKNANNARCFSFGIGSGASTTLVKGIAQAGRGTAEFITGGERMQPKVIRSLKKAIQPAITSAEVKFNLSHDFTVQAAPEYVPPIFIGERIIIYGIVNQTSADEVTPMAEELICLSGDLLGAKIEHNMQFHIPPPVAKDTHRVTTIHHLAAKTLIKEMAFDVSGKYARDDIIKLSCESNVISSLTGFIAIDTELQEPIKGSVETWDILPTAEEEQMSLHVAGLCAGPYVCSAPVQCGRKSKSFGFSELFSRKEKCGARRKKKGKWVTLGASAVSQSSLAVCKSSSAVSKSSSAVCKSSEDPSITIVDLQLASGAWRLTAELATVVGKKLDVIKATCPVSCKGEMETIWATIIALSYLEQNKSDQKEEWELVAAKAESWLAKQSLPKECSIQSLRQKAVDILK